MNSREKSFLYTLTMVLPYLWSFLILSSLSPTLKLPVICPVILGILLLAYISDKHIGADKPLYRCFSLFLVVAVYMLIIAGSSSNILYAVKLILVLSTPFTFAFIGKEIQRFGLIGYLYAAISLVIVTDYIRGGITYGWNSNTIALVAINGVFYLFLSIAVEGRQLVWLKLALSALLVYLISMTGCRSVLFGFAVFILVRYLIFNGKHISRTAYRVVCTILVTMPYWLMQLYLSLYRSVNRALVNQFFIKYTGKILFTEREKIWMAIFDNDLVGRQFWFGTGQLHINAHNIAVDIWFSFGLIGLLLFAALMLALLFFLYRHFQDRIVKTTVSCFLGLLVSQAFETVSFGLATQSYDILMYLFLAIAIGRTLFLSQEQPPEAREAVSE